MTILHLQNSKIDTRKLHELNKRLWKSKCNDEALRFNKKQNCPDFIILLLVLAATAIILLLL